MKHKNTLKLESLSNLILIRVTILALNNKFTKEQFHNPIFLSKFNYWLIEVKDQNINVTINENFDVDCVLNGIRAKTFNQSIIHSILKTYDK